MFIHLGQNTSVKKKDIIGIFDLDTSTVSIHTRNFLKKAEETPLQQRILKKDLLS